MASGKAQDSPDRKPAAMPAAPTSGFRAEFLEEIAFYEQRYTRLAEAVRALPEETMNYKSLKAYGSALLGWLDAKATQADR